ncbi:class I SAM-dependent RNA methyltransferase [Proteobacteria bacterium 005FR1]|nr:class I SAM-dependent RNA methyltransferase [Proteobacteria bacterium 005FR1]
MPRRTPAESAPKKGEIFSATVRDLASDGRGIVGHPCGLTVFVPGVWPGESGSFRFTGLQNRIGSAEVVTLDESSSARVQPRCPYHGFAPGDCGGCPWQFMDYPAQLAAKQRRVEAAAGRISKVGVQAIWPSPAVYGYRNRAQLKTNGAALGYVSPGSHQLAEIEDCPILTAPNRRTLKALLARLPEPEWRPHRNAKWTTLDLDESVDADSVAVNSRLPFQQANTAQNEAMRRWLAEKCAPLDKTGAVLELFCGSGNFTQVLAEAGFERIVAVDASGPATDALARRDLSNVTVVSRDLFKPESYGALFRESPAYSTLVLDPPRDGMRHLDALLGSRPKPADVFYISCDLATLFRDLAQLQSMAYTLVEIQPLDQAPHTPHIEVLCHLQLSV